MSAAFEKRLVRAENTSAQVARDELWQPLPGPQTLAYESTADVVGYGGAAGGGKTDLAIGKALTQHSRSAIFRRYSTEMVSIIDRVAEVLGHREGLNQVQGIWRLGGQVVEFGSVPALGDEKKYQGRPKDLLVIDEAANFLEAQVRFLMGWVRTVDPQQPCQTLLCFNPPTSAEGRWVVEFFRPWLDPSHHRPAMPGELRWFAMVGGKEVEVETADEFLHGDELVTPQSRTFIPAKVADNPYLSGTGYIATLQALPEPLRSQMLYGDFQAGVEDDPWQVVPTAWVAAAMTRWSRPARLPPMLALGVDVARGGRDSTVICRRHAGHWYDSLLVHAGSTTPDGPSTAGLVMAASRDRATIFLDVIGSGAAPFDFLNQARQHVVGVNVAESPTRTDQSGQLRFRNLRSQLWWQVRELLDPANNTGITLPQDQRLLADLTAPRWELSGTTVKVESREDIVKRIGRSPDFASALILAAAQPEDEFVVGIEDPTWRWDKPVVQVTKAEYDPLRVIDRELGLAP